eukprot:g5240.t1
MRGLSGDGNDNAFFSPWLPEGPNAFANAVQYGGSSGVSQTSPHATVQGTLHIMRVDPLQFMSVDFNRIKSAIPTGIGREAKDKFVQCTVKEIYPMPEQRKVKVEIEMKSAGKKAATSDDLKKILESSIGNDTIIQELKAEPVTPTEKLLHSDSFNNASICLQTETETCEGKSFF